MKRILIVLFILFPSFAKCMDTLCVLPKGIQFEPLIKEGDIAHSYFYRISYQKEIFLVSDGICLNLKNPNAIALAFPKVFKMNDVWWVSDCDFLFSDSSSIYHKDEQNDTIVRIVHTNTQQIKFKASHSGLYYYDKGSSDLFFFSFETAQSTKLCQFESPIVDISVIGNKCFVAYGRSFGVIIDNSEFVPLYRNNEQLTSIEVGPNGMLFYGTKDGLFYFDNEKHLFQISNLGVSSLLVNAEDLYIVFTNNSSGVLHGISLYKNIAEPKDEKKKSKKGFFNNLIPTKTHMERERALLKDFQIESAVKLYSETVQYNKQNNRTAAYNIDGEILAEYAYVLALHHDFETALMYIDRARMVGTKYGDFYAAQVLTLMGYTDAAQELMIQAKVPEWINSYYKELNEKYKTKAFINRDTPADALKRANKLAANKQTIQAIALFEDLKATYSETYIIYVDYGIVWESLGHCTYASQMFQIGIDKIPQEQKDNEVIFRNHLNMLNMQKSYFEKPWIKRILGTNPPKMMTYVGASAAKDMYSLNGRVGLYTSNRFSTSLNLGLNYGGEQFSGSIGLSAYKAWGVFVTGLGITDTFSKDQNIFSLTPSVGLSFLNKKQTSSFDIMVNGYIPFSSEQKFSYSISIGKTIYFDLNGLRK